MGDQTMDDERKARRDRRDDSRTPDHDIPHAGGHRPSGAGERRVDAGLPLPSDLEPPRPEAAPWGSPEAGRGFRTLAGLDRGNGRGVDRGASRSGRRRRSPGDVGYVVGRYIVGPIVVGVIVVIALGILVGAVALTVLAVSGIGRLIGWA